MDDARAVMEAVGAERGVLIGYSEGSSLVALFATTHPERTSGLILYGSFFAWDWMAAGRFPTRHESFTQAIDEIEQRWGSPDYCDELLANDAPSKLGDERFRRGPRRRGAQGRARRVAAICRCPSGLAPRESSRQRPPRAGGWQPR